MAGRQRRSPAVVTIYWRDIPAQVTAKQGRETHKELLPARFQHAIDRAAMVAGKTDTHSYVAEWRRESAPVDGDPATVAANVATELDRSYPRERLEALVDSGGLEPESPTPVDQ